MEINITDINSKIKAAPKEFVAEIDGNYFTQIKDVARFVFKNRCERPVVLVSGPSGSGKTTSSHILETFLDEMGAETHTLSMDNYFRSLGEAEKEAAQQGLMDLESPDRLNIELLNPQLEDIINCRAVEIPVYDFVNSCSVKSGEILERKPDELVILEGIHALNPEVVTIPDEKTVKVYVSVRTRVVCENHTIHPENIRLIRRMIRDNINRGRTYSQTCLAAESVKRGEDKYIMPYKYRSDFDIDTFIPYEIGVYKEFFKTQLENIKSHGEMGEIIKLITPAEPLSEAFVPEKSLIREFIGGKK